jgi:hypothetical protein
VGGELEAPSRTMIELGFGSIEYWRLGWVKNMSLHFKSCAGRLLATKHFNDVNDDNTNGIANCNQIIYQGYFH